MARIFRTDIYDYQTLPTFDDYVIGTDPDDSNRTRNYRIADIIGLANGTATLFTTLFDTPASYSGQAGKAVIVNEDEDGLIFGEVSGGDFVTLDTVQTITSGKFWSSNQTFNAFVLARGGIQLNATNASLNTISSYQRNTTPSGNDNGGAAGEFYLNSNDNWSFLSTSTGGRSWTVNNDNLTEARVYTLQNESGTIAHLSDITPLPYKEYVAILSQSGTSAPTATVLLNTTGETWTWVRGATGVYSATPTTGGGYDGTRATMFATLSQGSINSRTYKTYVGPSSVSLMTENAGTLSDNLLVGNSSVTIRIYD